MQELETLLNSLIQRGWKPWGKGVDKIVVCPKEEFADGRNLFIEVFFSNGFSTYRSFRELVSLESGLWKFIVENKLYKPTNCKYEAYYNYKWDWYNFIGCINVDYRLLESALLPEEELGKFLVDNIKLKW